MSTAYFEICIYHSTRAEITTGMAILGTTRNPSKRLFLTLNTFSRKTKRHVCNQKDFADYQCFKGASDAHSPGEVGVGNGRSPVTILLFSSSLLSNSFFTIVYPYFAVVI